MPKKTAPLSKPQRRVLDDALRLVRGQRRRAEADEEARLAPEAAWATPFGLGYMLGAVDGLCQVHGVRFDRTALAIVGLVLDDTFGRPTSDALRQRAVALLQAGDADFARGRPWGGNEAIGLARGLMEPVGLVHLARGDEHRMGPPTEDEPGLGVRGSVRPSRRGASVHRPARSSGDRRALSSPMAPLARSVRVFLIEDHAWLLQTMADTIARQDGVEVCGTAGSGEDALASLPDVVDVVLVDLRLPGMSGLDVVRALAARRPDVACLVLSAQPAVEVRAKALDAGAVAYVEKGDLNALLHAIRTSCHAP